MKLAITKDSCFFPVIRYKNGLTANDIRKAPEKNETCCFCEKERNNMVLTVSDIRKALEKYSDDTIVLDKLSENVPSIVPILKDSFSLSWINVEELKKHSRWLTKCPEKVKSGVCLSSLNLRAAYNYVDFTCMTNCDDLNLTKVEYSREK